MSEIKVNLENLKYNEREQLLALIEKANKKPKRFKPEGNEVYWTVTGKGSVMKNMWENNFYDKGLYDINNCFKTKEEAKFEAEKRKVVAELEIFALENNDEIDWGDDNQPKYSLFYDHDQDLNTSDLIIDWNRQTQYQGTTCFSSEELCKQATEKVGKDRIKKYLFGVEE